MSNSPIPPRITLSPRFEAYGDQLDKDKWKNEIEDPTAEGLEPSDLETYILRKFSLYENTRRCGALLQDYFQRDFEGWNEPLWKKITKELRDECREFLVWAGIFIPRSSSNSIASRIVDVLTRENYRPWTEEEKKTEGDKIGGFSPHWKTYYHQALPQVSVPQTAPPQTRQPFPTPNSTTLRPRLPEPPRSVSPLQNRDASRLSTPASSLDERTGNASGAQISFQATSEAQNSLDNELDTQDHANGTTQENGQAQDLTQSQTRSAESSAPPLNFARQLTDLAKLYSDDSKKYGGELYDMLHTKLLIFYDLCTKVGLPEEQYHNAYSSMLKGRPSTFYYESLSNKGFNFRQMITMTQEVFENEATQQEYLKLWKACSLATAIESHPEKSKLQCLDMVVDRLKKIQPGLPQSWKEPESLRSQLISACHGVQECELALFRPDPTFEAVYAQLRNAIYTRSEQAGIQQFHQTDESNEHGSEQYWIDRKYNGKGRYNSGNTRGRSQWRGRSTSRFSSPSGPRSKTCFICKKPDCWSTNHTDEERQEAYGRFKRQPHFQGRQRDATPARYQSFLADWEGVKGLTDRDDDEVDRFLAETDPHIDDELDIPPEGFLTEFGPIDPKKAMSVLNNQSTLHAITKYRLGDNSVFTIASRYSSLEFHGIMPDTGASGVSTAGEPQVQALQKINDQVQIDTTRAGEHNIKFGIGDGWSIGTVDVLTPLGVITFHVVPANTPFLFCVQDMDRMGVRFDNLRNVLIQGSKTVPVIRKFGHPFMLLHHSEQSLAYCHLTETELKQLHRRFGHPSVQRLARVLYKSNHDFNMRALEQIQKFCHHCQMHEKAPGRFKFSLKDEYNFNHTIIVDVLYLNDKPVMHVVDVSTSFQNAQFLKDLSAKCAWDTIRKIWVDTYQGPPDNLVHDAGTNFASKEFRANAKAMSIDIHEVPVEAHNSVGKVERYHGPLRRAFNILKAEIPDAADDLILQMAVKAVNDTAGPDGLVPTLLVFGAYPRMTDESAPSSTVVARGEAIRKAMKEVQKIRAERQVTDALAMRNGPNTTATIALPLQSQVRVWREKRGWTGPFILLARDGDECLIDMPRGPTRFRITVVKPYYQDPEEHVEPELEKDDDQDQDHDQGQVDETPPDEDPSTIIVEAPDGTVRRGRGRPKGSKNRAFMTFFSAPDFQDSARNGQIDQMEPEQLVTAKEESDMQLAVKLRSDGVITTPGEPFQASDQREIESLIESGVLDIQRFDPSKHGNVRIFNSRLVREVKAKTTDKPYEKSRLVIQAYNDEGKQEILTQSPTIQRASQRAMVMLAPSLIKDRRMKLWLRDITQAYTQSTSYLGRLIIAHLPEQLQAQYPDDFIMVILKPLYGVPEAGTHWYATYHKHHLENLSMTTSTYDPCLLITQTPGSFGLVGMQTDDTLILAEDSFAELEQQKLTFTAKPKEQLTLDNPLLFNGCVLSLNKDGSMDLRQKGQGKKLEIVNPKLDENLQKQIYTAQRARGAYIATICQPEASFDLSTAAQHQSPTGTDITALNKRLKWQKDNQERGLRAIPLDLSTGKLFVFVDGSFANNSDMSSQLGFIIVVANETSTEEYKFTINGNVIHYTSVKSKRVTRSVLASEIYGMVAGVDMAYALSTTLKMITDQLDLPAMPTIVCTDSYSLYECLVKLGTTKEKRLMIDIMALRESYERRELYEIRWINGLDNPADAMTKAKPNGALQSLIDSNCLDVRVEGWVKRD